MNIEIISGSPRKNSVTNRVARFLQKHLSEKTTHHIGLIDVREYNLPPFLQEVIRHPDKAPAHLQSLAQRIFSAQAFILVSPEYNGSYTPALKNLLDHFPKQLHKCFAIATASTGGMGGIRASQQMQLLINGLFGIASPYMLIVPFVDQKFDEEGNLVDAAFQSSIDTFIAEFLWLGEHLYPGNKHADN